MLIAVAAAVILTFHAERCAAATAAVNCPQMYVTGLSNSSFYDQAGLPTTGNDSLIPSKFLIANIVVLQPVRHENLVQTYAPELRKHFD